MINLLCILISRKYRNKVSTKYTSEVVSKYHWIENEIEKIYKINYSKNQGIAA